MRRPILYYIRHGETDWNRQGRFQGRTDNPLNDDGIAQAHAAAERLQQVALGQIVSSPLVRALKTAEIIAAAAAKTVTVDRGLIELDFGSFEGKPVRETMMQHGANSAQGLVDMLPPMLSSGATSRNARCAPSASGWSAIRGTSSCSSAMTR